MAKGGGFRPHVLKGSAGAAQSKLKQGLSLHQQGNLADAERAYVEVLRLSPGSFDALHGLGLIAVQTGRAELGVELIGKAIATNGKIAVAHSNLGKAFLDLNRAEQALESCDRAIALKDDFADAHINRGAALINLGRLHEALASYDRAIRMKPDNARAHHNRAMTLRKLRRSNEALISSGRAIALRPDYVDAYINRGDALTDMKRLTEALTNYDKAIALRPSSAPAWLGRGGALAVLNRFGEAVAAYDKAIVANPDLAEAWFSRGVVLARLKRHDEAIFNLDKALELKPTLIEAEGVRLNTKLFVCDWASIDDECARIISLIRSGMPSTQPFALLALPSLPADQLHCARLYVTRYAPEFEAMVRPGERYGHDQIRLAYLSPDFRVHAMSHLIVGMFECHDRSRFQVTGLSIGPNDHSELRQRVQASFQRFMDVGSWDDDRIAALIQSLEIDVLVDLAGFTTNSRPGIVARRPAPVQVSYLGFPGTMGAEYIDYFIADRIVVPDDHRRFYSEKVIHLPHSYMANDNKLGIAERVPTRTELGLPPDSFVFVCFNNSYKITPRVFDCWMRILARVKGSVLWLLESSAVVVRNLRSEAVARGVEPERLIFAKHVPPAAEHLARYRAADLFLDTLPYNAHTTASDALWAGLPVLTCLGDVFAGRVAASLLNAIELPEMITTTLDAYERSAIELATNPKQLAAVKQKLAGNRLTTPLFDTKRFTRHMESAITEMHRRHQDGLPPDHIVISES